MGSKPRHREKWIKGTIAERTGPLSYTVETQKGTLRKHIDQLQSRSESIEVEPMQETMEEPIPSSTDSSTPTQPEDDNPEATTESPDIPPTPTPAEDTREADTTTTPSIAESRPRRTMRPPSYLSDYV